MDKTRSRHATRSTPTAYAQRTGHKDVAIMLILVAAVVIPVLIVALGMDIKARRRGTQAAAPQDPSAAPLTEQTFWGYAAVE